MVVQKRVAIIALTLAAIPLSVMFIAISNRNEKPKSLHTKRSLRHASSKLSATINTAPCIQQQDRRSLARSQSPRKRQKTTEGTIDVIANTIPATTSDAENETSMAPIAVTVPTQIESPHPSEIIVRYSQTSKKEEKSLSDEAKKAGESLKELIIEAINNARDSAKATEKQRKEQTDDVAATSNAKDIQSLTDNINTLPRLFEQTIIEIRREPYDRQIKLLESYRDLLQTQSKVVNARGRMASKLKPGS